MNTTSEESMENVNINNNSMVSDETGSCQNSVHDNGINSDGMEAPTENQMYSDIQRIPGTPVGIMGTSVNNGNQDTGHQQHVVQVHISPGETFTVSVDGQLKHIQGPATVSMVSNNGPPLPMQMQVPPGHMVQQIVDKDGILTRDIVATTTRHDGKPNDELKLNTTDNRKYKQSHISTTKIKGGPNNAQQYYQGTNDTESPPINSTNQSHSAEHHSGIEEERRAIQLQLSKMPTPKVTDIESRSALILLSAPEVDTKEYEIDVEEFNYELMLCDKGRDGKYKRVYSGDAIEITLQDLKPATEYHLQACTIMDNLRGSPTEVISFKTSPCEPDQPQHPKLQQKTNTYLQLKWNSPNENGSKISAYVLESEVGDSTGNFVVVYNGVQKQCRLSNLTPATKYTFRLTAINNIGKSEYSEPVSFCTSGSAPSQPDPPMLSECYVTELVISWIKRPNEDEFALQIDDQISGHGFIPVYNGPLLSHRINGLRRNREYKFRLAARNEAGSSKWSDIVAYKTLPALPEPPSKPKIKGNIHPHYFRTTLGRNDTESPPTNSIPQSHSAENHSEIEEERRAIQLQLSKMPTPKVTDIESRSALIQLSAPEVGTKEYEMDVGEFNYQLMLCEKGRDGKYKCVYSGDATEITLKDLKPATEYHLKVFPKLGDLRGSPTEAISFKTSPCEPDQPQHPKLQQNLHLKRNTQQLNFGHRTFAEAKVPDEVAYDPYKLFLYKKAIREGKERENTLRINVIGNYAQGKTSLVNRLVGKTCKGVTSTNGIEINRYKCQISDDGTRTIASFENESHEFVNRVATVARSIEKSQTLKSPVTKSEEPLTYDHSEQSTTQSETSQYEKQSIEKQPNVSMEVNGSRVDDLGDLVQPTLLQILEAKEKKRMTLSSKELTRFSNVVEEQKDTSPELIDIWDFGGQYIFYATHTLFHSRKALYLLVFDLSKPLDTVVLDEEFPGETGDRNMEYFARFWIESINAYVGPDAQVILVGTHKDQFQENDRSVKDYFEKVRCLFDDTDLIYHIQKEDFAVSNYDPSDPGIADLNAFILKKHKWLVQPVEIPARWIQLEKALRAWQTSSIISFQDVKQLDKDNEYPLLDEEQLKLFLHYHHEKGSLYYYDDDLLSDFICLEPQFLVDAFKCIITSEQFYKNCPEIRSLWKQLSKEGRLTRQLIDKVWSNEPDFMIHKDALLGFLKKQNIIAEVVEYNTNSEEKKQKDWFIVPSLLKDHSLKDELMCFLSRKAQSQVRYLMKFDKPSVVHLTFHKVVAAALGIWPVVNCGTKLLLFENLCVFKLIRNHAGLLEQRKDSGTIELRVMHLLPKQVESLPADEFRRFVESIVLHEFRRLKNHKEEKDKHFVAAYRCNHADHGPAGSSQLTHFKEDEDVICPDNITHDSFDYKRAKGEWFIEDTMDEVYPKMQLTEKTLSRLAQCAIGANWSLLGPQLQIKQAQLDHIEMQHQRIEMRIYSMLLKWKDIFADKATLDMLVDAIKKCPGVNIYWDEIRNIKDEYLRKQNKQGIDLVRPLSNEIVKVTETLTLNCEITKSCVSVTWLKDGKPIIPDGQKEISSNGGVHQLVVKNVTMEDGAKYTCRYGNSITECYVKIEDPYGQLKFIKELSDIEVGDRPSTATFLCELNRSQIEVEWYYRSQRLYPSNKYTIIDDGSTHMLKIRDVSKNDEGKYLVLAKGLSSEATLYVEETEEERHLLAQHGKRRKREMVVEQLPQPDGNANEIDIEMIMEEVKRVPSDKRKQLIDQVIQAVSEAHMTTVRHTRQMVTEAEGKFTRKKVMIENGTDSSNLSISPSHMWQKVMANKVSDLTQAVKFCKKLPGFGELERTDQIVLIKKGIFEILLCRMCLLADHDKEEMFDPDLEMKCSRMMIRKMPMGSVTDEHFDVAAQLNPIGLTDEELGIFSAVLIMCPECERLTNVSAVDKLKKLFLQTLCYAMRNNHKDYESKFARLLSVIPVFRDVNRKHVMELNKMKMQRDIVLEEFPELYKEIFNIRDETDK